MSNSCTGTCSSLVRSITRRPAVDSPCTDPADGMEARLEALNLTDEKWGYFLLVGGFVFFDGEKKMLQKNALVLMPFQNFGLRVLGADWRRSKRAQ